jgi:formate dehydrogenase major subunit
MTTTGLIFETATSSWQWEAIRFQPSHIIQVRHAGAAAGSKLIRRPEVHADIGESGLLHMSFVRTDIAFLGDDQVHPRQQPVLQEYVANYTNAPFIVNKEFGFKDGLFAGYQKTGGVVAGKYDKSKWAFEMDKNGVPKMDRSLKDGRCVFQLLKKHYSRYNTKIVSQITGTPEKDLVEVYKTTRPRAKPDKAGTIMYAMGLDQHTVGVQNIRAMCMIQLLLGNMGIAGGGVTRCAGESNVRGFHRPCPSVSHPAGYLKTPRASNTS